MTHEMTHEYIASLEEARQDERYSAVFNILDKISSGEITDEDLERINPRPEDGFEAQEAVVEQFKRTNHSFAGVDFKVYFDGVIQNSVQAVSCHVDDETNEATINMVFICFDEDLMRKHKFIESFYCIGNNDYADKEAAFFLFKNLRRTNYGSAMSVDDVQLGCQMQFVGEPY